MSGQSAKPILYGTDTTEAQEAQAFWKMLRALIEEGLKRDGDRATLINVEGQVQAVRRIRSHVRRAGTICRPGIDRAVSSRKPQVGRT